MATWVEPSGRADNGMTLWEVPLAGTRAVTVVIAFPAGSRHETREENGIAHLLEHLAFKGSDRFADRSRLRLQARMLGGELNAYTSQDTVTFHITGRERRLMDLLDLLSEFPATAHLTAQALESERGVVIQEIARSLDSPAKRVGKLLTRLAYGDHPLGRPVLGPVEHIETFTRDQVVAFRDRTWVPSQGVCVIAGNLDHLDRPSAFDMLGRFPSRPAAPAAEPALPYRAQVQVLDENVEQSKLWLAYRLGGDKRDVRVRAAQLLMTRILSDRLTEELRQRRSLCYSTGASSNAHIDAPRLWASVGLAPEKAPEAYQVMRELIADFAAGGVTEYEWRYARAYEGTQTVLDREDAASVATAGAAHLLTFQPDRFSPDAFIEALDSISLDELNRTAAAIDIDAGVTVAAVGPHQPDDFTD